jgi:hypothetical protein
MKIAIIGTHGVGKTTIVNDVCSQLGKYDIPLLKVREQSRDWIEEYGFSWRNCNPYQFGNYELGLFHYFMFMFMFDNNIISDRSPFDVAAYAKLFCPQSFMNKIYDGLNENRAFLKNGITYYLYVTQDPVDRFAYEVQEEIITLLTLWEIKPIIIYRNLGSDPNIPYNSLPSSVVKKFGGGGNSISTLDTKEVSMKIVVEMLLSNGINPNQGGE